MSIPLDRLYDHLHNKSNHDMIIYRWLPHGSKNLRDLLPLNDKFFKNWVESMTTPIAIMHDQEPLYFNLWSDSEFADCWQHLYTQQHSNNHHLDPKIIQYHIDLHLRSLTGPGSNLHDLVLLVHSEENSEQVFKYRQHGFLPVYYWSHAIIAADWFRYAKHDPVLEYDVSNFKHDFLIYNRAWSGSREYRLTFAELLVDHNLISSCLTTFSPTDSDQYYTNYKFKNTSLTIKNCALHQIYKLNQHLSSSSADYNNRDYAMSGMEIVLETLFDDSRLHLTEKTLRPIACGKPFMLAATAGSLQYLRRYGFETFGEYINESYDLITDPRERLQSIISEMCRISAMPQDQKLLLWHNLQVIAKRNQLKFFSQSWQQSIEQEFFDNLDSALEILSQNRTGKYWRESLTMPQISGSTGRPQEDILALKDWLKKHN